MRNRLSKVHAPTKDDVLDARLLGELTQKQAAQLLYVEERTWQRWEAGATGMAPAFWELFLLKTGVIELPY